MTNFSPASEGNFLIPRPYAPLPFTGERMTSALSGQIEYEHLHRYCLARDLCAGRDVLDVASGEGYGAALLASVALSVVGVELDAASVMHARAQYEATRPRLRYVQADALAMPLPNASFDAVVSFETIEHVSDIARFLDEVQRVLRPGGLLIVSTPDRTVYSAAGQDVNPYHVYEMSGAEFAQTLQARFQHVVVGAQRPVLGSVIATPAAGQWRSYERRSLDRAEASGGLSRAPYLVALASDGPPPAMPSSIYLDERRVHDVVEAAAEVQPLRERAATLQAAVRQAEAEARIAADAHARAMDAAAMQEGQARQGLAASHEAALAAKEQETAAARERLDARSRDVTRLRGELARADLLAEQLRRGHEQQAEHVEHLKGLLAERAEAWERLHVALDARNDEIARLGAAMQQAEAGRAALHDSFSWRITGPVRRASKVLRRLRQVARLPRRAMAAYRLRRRRAHEIAALRETSLFDPAWYSAQVAGLAASGSDPAAHFAWVGAAAGLRPNAWFDPAWYRAQHPEVAASGENPLLHWVRTGAERQLDPNPFLDAKWYVQQHPEAEPDPLRHWIEHGRTKGFDPNPMLDSEAFILEYPAARDGGQDPLLYWWAHGVADGLSPHPMFDAAWYAARHGLPPGADPLAHWLATGRTQGLPTAAALDGPPTPIVFPVEADPDVTIVIPAYAHYADTYRCLHALHANSGALRIEVIVADDCPEHRTVPLLSRRIQGVRWVQNPENLGFLRNCNAAEKLAVGRYVVFLNNDALVQPGWLEPLVRLADADPLVGIVGCKVLNADGSLQEAGGAILDNGWGEPYGAGDDPARAEYNFVREVDVVVGACFLVRRAAFDALGGFDLSYAPAFYEEFDLAFALRQAGYSTWYQPESRVVHLGSNSYGAEMRDRQSVVNHARFRAKWNALLPAQPSPGAPELRRRQRPAIAGHVLVVDDKVLEWNRQAGALTIYQYIGLLRREGYHVTYGAATNAAPTQPYLGIMQQDGIEVLLGADTIRGWLRRNGPHLAFIWTARPDVAGPLLWDIRGTTTSPILYYTHDLHYLRERRRWEQDGDPAALEESKRLRRIEHDIFFAVDRVMTPSRVEAGVIAADVPDAEVCVIPPYIVPPAAERTRRAESQDAVTFVGGFAHLPNADAAIWLVQEIMPLVWREAPELKAVIVGSEPPPSLTALAGPRVEVTGFVEDLGPVYARSVCTVSPLRYGAGIKGKIVGSIEAGVPVVTTAVGNEGLDLADGVEALIADTPDAIAAAAVALWRDPARRAALARSGIDRLCRGYGAGTAQAALRAVLGRRCCRVCGTVTPVAAAGTPNWREAFACPACHALTRMEALADVLVDAYAGPHEVSLHQLLPRLRRLRIHEFGFVGSIVGELRGTSGFSCSDYFPGVPPGTNAPNDVRCEDMTALTYADESFDLAISQDVLEHVPDPRRALRECLRVLKPGGRMLLSTPVAPDREETVVRARLEADGQVTHLLPPEFHGDPVRDEGALVFSDFGRDLSAMLVEAGFEVTRHQRVAEGEANGYLVTFDAVRPGSPIT